MRKTSKDLEPTVVERRGTDLFDTNADPLRAKHAVPLDVPGWPSECRRTPAKGSAEYWYLVSRQGRENPEISETYALRKALEVSPNHLPAKLRLAYRLILEYKFAEAHQHLSEALAAKSQHPRNATQRQNLCFLILFNQGLCLYQMAQYNRALTTIDRAMREHDPAQDHANELKSLREIRFWCYFRLGKGSEEFGGMLAASEICMDEQRRSTTVDGLPNVGGPQQPAERLSVHEVDLSDTAAQAEKQSIEGMEEEPTLWLDDVLDELNKSPAERDTIRCAELCKNLSFFQRFGREEGASILNAAEPRRLDTASSTLFKRAVPIERESVEPERKDTKNVTGLDEIFVLMSGAAELQFQPAKPAEDTGIGMSWPAIKCSFRPGDPITFSDVRLQELLTETLADSQDMPGGVKEWNAVVLSLEPCWLLQIDPTEYMRVVRSSVGERDLADQVTLLRRIPLFHSVMDAQLKDIASRLVVEHYHYGDVVVHPGVATAGLYVLWQGNAQIVLPSSNNESSLGVLNESAILFKLSTAAYCGFGAIKDPPEKPQMALIVTSCKADFFLLPKKGLTSILEVLPKMQAMVGKAVDPLAPTEEMLKRAKRSMGQWTFWRRKLLEGMVHRPENMAKVPTSPLGELPPPRPLRKCAIG